MKVIFVYITNPTIEAAKNMVQSLLEQKLIACANFFPIHSMYWWKGNIEADAEVVVIAKTIESKWAQLKKEIKKQHSYEVPCITKIPVEVNKEFGEWMNKTIVSRES